MGRVGVSQSRRCCHRFWVALLVISEILLGQRAWASGPTVTFDLPAGDFAKMVLEFGRQAGVAVWYTSVTGSVKGITTHAVSGTLSASDALTRMLEGTGFSFEWEDERSVVLYIGSPKDRERRRSKGPPEEGRLEAGLRPVSLANIQQVVVTGTYLRGVESVIAPMARVGRRELNKTGYATAEAAIDDLPMNFGGGAREGFGSSSVVGNFNGGEAPNLRGLGPGATLVLVNGRRQPASGSVGNFVDISAVPVSAIKRIDIMPDGASALYGSDAIAGVVNVVLRDDLDGAETRTRLASVQGGGDEILLAQLAAWHWDGGHALFDYQFSKRDALAATERAYVWNADKRALGGDDFRSFQSNPGNILDPRTLQPAFAIPSGQDGRDLHSSDLLSGQTNLQNPLTGLDLLPERMTHSVYLTGSQSLSPRLEGFAELRFNRRSLRQSQLARSLVLTVPTSNPFYVNPFSGSPYVLVAYNFYDDLGPIRSSGHVDSSVGTLGLRGNLMGAWRATLAATYGREHLHYDGFNLVDPNALAAALADPDPATAFNPFGAGSNTNLVTLDSIRYTQRERTTSQITTADFVADGPLFELPAGSVKLAVGVGARREQLDGHEKSYAREIDYAFSEFSLPLVRQLKLSAAARYERYNDFGSVLNQKWGLTWTPSTHMKVRGSWGTSFRAPLLVDLDESTGTVAGLLSLPDPRSPSGQSLVLGVQGNNAHLHQETASSWTAGIDFEAPARLAASLTYFGVTYRDQVTLPGSGNPFTILYEEQQWGAPVIIRHPSRAQLDAICAIPEFFGSRSDCYSGLADVIADFRLRNLASTTVRGIDVALSQSLPLSHGEIRWAVDGTYLLQYERGITPSVPAVSLLDTLNNPISRRVRATLDWFQHGEKSPGFAATVTAHYAGAYRDDHSIPMRRIDASTTLDLQVAYRTPKGDRWLDGLEFAFGANNIFNSDPPFANVDRGYDVANADPAGRLLTLFIEKSW